VNVRNKKEHSVIGIDSKWGSTNINGDRGRETTTISRVGIIGIVAEIRGRVIVEQR
jgi:hypothetical protein